MIKWTFALLAVLSLEGVGCVNESNSPHQDPPPMSFDGITLIVKDLEAQKVFYRDMLGLPIESDYGNAVFFRLGDRKLGLFALGHHPAGDESLEGAEKGVSHMEFGISSSQYEELKKRLIDHGFHSERDNFRDADGNLFHFNYDGKINW